MVANSAGQTNPVSLLEDLDNPDLGASEAAPPAYGDLHDQLQLSQAGIEAGAAVTDDGRVTININQKDRRLSQILAPTLSRQLLADIQAAAGPLPPAYIPPSLGGQPGQTPPPRLNVVIQIVGSRGDVQPFIALGQVLKDTYGHRVRVATHPTFETFVKESGLEFFSIGGDPAELMAFMVKNPGLMPGIDALTSGEVTKRRQGIQTMLMGCWRSCIESGNGLGPPPPRHRPSEPMDLQYQFGDTTDKPFVADAIIANPPSFAHIHLAEKLGIPLHIMFTMPWSPTRAFPHPLANIESTNTTVLETNIISYALVDMLTWQGLGDVINRFRTRILDLEPMSLIWAPGLLSRLRIPTTYCWSPALIPKPADWGAEVTISGFYFLNLASSYTPDPDLAAFLAAGPPPVYIGFGSIVVDDPNKLTRTIFDAVSATGVRALVSKGWGGLGADALGIPDNVFMLGNCPHDWLFPRVSAVVHHGGAGTSAAGIKAGKPTIVVPFFGDQPFWGAMIAKAGAGPAPIPAKKLNAENLAEAIKEALKPETKARAEELGEKLRSEKGADVGGKSFHQFLDTDKLRCSLAPSRVAVWRVRRTKTRLSALAAAVLVNEGILQYSDLKLCRHQEYNTEEQPWDPITAVTSALVGDIGTMAMAVADFPREIFKPPPPHDAGDTPLCGKVPEPTSEVPAQSADGATLASTPSAASLSTITSDTTSTAPSQPSLFGMSSHRSLIREASARHRSPSSSPSRGSSRRNHDPTSPGRTVNVETAIEAGENVGRIVTTGMKMPLNFCMGLARGFRNAPKLYHDDTVRPMEKVTNLSTGLKVAGKEFGLGFYDGISGLVTQPLRSVEKEGARGFLKGVGKGIGGLVLKPAAAVWSLPAYAMQGVQAEVRNLFARSSLNSIMTARVRQGREDLRNSTVEEQKDILVRWQTHGEDLKGFYSLKAKERGSGGNLGDSPDGRSRATTPMGDDALRSPSRTSSWLHSRGQSFGLGKRRQEQQPLHPSASDTSLSTVSDDEFERAIRASVQQTSRGDKDEDARVEAAIRASVKEMRRTASLNDREVRDPGYIPGQGQYPQEKVPVSALADSPPDMSDEEYQALIEQAVTLSLAEQQARQGAGADDAELTKAMEESERAHRMEMDRQRTEEDIVLEYVKKQSLAEEDFRRAKAKGKAVSGNEEDADLKRAMEESLRTSGSRGGASGDAGPS
ncbi:glycosyltransferase family 28 domain-containing protein [Echria macrotheca]|uniref:Glycosyltransferase family 28 domain-containing protein n=1 Tax=Echria macrotheca TaxID=438768 RepID=A0AAJ0BC00_9PEZI|nr:glycosyltransferase family 28 domain-containing protein [Echria macrotheca]